MKSSCKKSVNMTIRVFVCNNSYLECLTKNDRLENFWQVWKAVEREHFFRIKILKEFTQTNRLGLGICDKRKQNCIVKYVLINVRKIYIMPPVMQGNLILLVSQLNILAFYVVL